MKVYDDGWHERAGSTVLLCLHHMHMCLPIIWSCSRRVTTKYGHIHDYNVRFGEKYTMMDDMNGRVAQYGFVVMFAAAFPLAPIIAFLIEYLVRRADIDR